MVHRHQPQGEPEIRPFSAPVAQPENRAAHGNIVEHARCACGAVRLRNRNGRHVESSGWIEPEEV